MRHGGLAALFLGAGVDLVELDAVDLLALDQLGLARIDHFDLHKPLGMRLVGHCLLDLRSSDTSSATVILYGIPGLEQLADTLREYSLRERTRRRLTTFVQA